LFGDADDVVLGSVVQDSGLAAGDSYTGSVTYCFGPVFSRHGKVKVRSDILGAIWENGSEANNQAGAADTLT
jgi:hypothetical protein